MNARSRSGLTALLVSFAAIAGVSACDGDEAGGGGDDAGSGGTLVAGATASGGGAGRGGLSSSGGTSGSGSGLAPASGGSRNAAGAAGRGGGPAAGGTTANGGRSGSMNDSGGAPEPPDGDSPYEIECHGDTVMCGNPTSLLCLGIRVGTDVFGYSCSNECQSDADCSDRPASADAAAGCVDFVNKKYCLLVCKNGDEQASCPTGMYCYVYEGAPTGYCLWH